MPVLATGRKRKTMTHLFRLFIFPWTKDGILRAAPTTVVSEWSIEVEDYRKRCFFHPKRNIAFLSTPPTKLCSLNTDKRNGNRPTKKSDKYRYFLFELYGKNNIVKSFVVQGDFLWVAHISEKVILPFVPDPILLMSQVLKRWNNTALKMSFTFVRLSKPL